MVLHELDPVCDGLLGRRILEGERLDGYKCEH